METHTIVSQATPMGHSSIAVVRLSGSRSFEFTESLSGVKKSRKHHDVVLLPIKNKYGEKIDSGIYENKLDKYEYWEKDNAMGAGQSVGLTYNVLRSNHSQRFGWAYHMELIDSTDLSNLACATEGSDARGYTPRIKSFASQNTSLLQAATTYYCLDKLHRGEVDSYEINVLQRPRYKVYNETTSQFANIMAPETFEVEINKSTSSFKSLLTASNLFNDHFFSPRYLRHPTIERTCCCKKD